MTEAADGGDPEREAIEGETLASIFARIEAAASGGPECADQFEAALLDLDREIAPKARARAAKDADADLAEARKDAQARPGPESVDKLRKALLRWRRAHGIADSSRIPAATDVAVHVAAVGPLAHVATGLPTLDRATRGGLLAARMHMVGGEPDAGKTGFVVQLALFWARSGYAVVMHCADEPRESILDRLGQAFGLALEDLEARKPPAMRFLAERLAEIPQLLLVDQRLDGMSVQQSASELDRLAVRLPDCLGKIFVADSLQTARAWAPDARPREKRERVEAAVAALADIAAAGPLVIATSELARSAYRAKKTADRTREIAAFKETGDIEYAITTGLVLTAEKGERDVVRVGVAKNKRGLYLPFRLRRDLDRCTYEDLGATAEEETPEPAAQKVASSRPQGPAQPKFAQRAREALVKHGPIGWESWILAIGGNKTQARDAARWLREQGETRWKADGQRGRLYMWHDPAVAEGDQR